MSTKTCICFGVYANPKDLNKVLYPVVGIGKKCECILYFLYTCNYEDTLSVYFFPFFVQLM